MIKRQVTDLILERLFLGKAILITGPRQVGKTTLVKEIAVLSGKSSLLLNGDEYDVREMFARPTSTQLGAIIGNSPLVIIDEAQRIENIGLVLKLCVDNFPQTQMLVTGSSTLELAGKINEPLTGRKFEFELFPFSYLEMAHATSSLEERRMLEHRMVFGYYPDVVVSAGKENEILQLLTNSYLYKDLLAYQQIKKPSILEKLVQALALQIGQEVSFHELGQLIGLDTTTVERYIDLLEKSYVVFRLPSLNRNMRNEIKKGRKIYFYDTGIRNAIIKNFNRLALRQDVGALWENFLIAERYKYMRYSQLYANRFFWRTVAQQEIDYLEEYNGILHAYEFKWNPRKIPRFPQSFLAAYPGSQTMLVQPDNFEGFITGRKPE
ncbi:MAG: ATP-binding protein [Chitinivibrionales bacterium]|nr:ATP-binding protein [Chitinivibrionales bacterium]